MKVCGGIFFSGSSCERLLSSRTLLLAQFPNLGRALKVCKSICNRHPVHDARVRNAARNRRQDRLVRTYRLSRSARLISYMTRAWGHFGLYATKSTPQRVRTQAPATQFAESVKLRDTTQPFILTSRPAAQYVRGCTTSPSTNRCLRSGTEVFRSSSSVRNGSRSSSNVSGTV